MTLERLSYRVTMSMLTSVVFDCLLTWLSSKYMETDSFLCVWEQAAAFATAVLQLFHSWHDTEQKPRANTIGD